MKKLLASTLAAVLTATTLAGCGSSAKEPETSAAATTTDAETETAAGTEAAAGSASWPVKTLEIICPDSTGTGADLRARILAPYLEKELGITVVVTSKSGGGSTLCSQTCMDAPNDGSVMMLMHNAFISTKVWGTVDYDYRDAEMVSNMFSDNTNIICANVQSGITSFDELVERCKAEPESVNTVCDIGSIIYLTVASMEDALDIKIGKADAGGITERIATVVGGHADSVILNASSLKSYVDAGELTPLAVLGDQRIDLFPDLPTVKELGYEWSWPATGTAAFLPPETDPGLVNMMDEALAKIAVNPDFIAELVEVEGADLTNYMSTEEAMAYWDEQRISQEEAYEAAGLGT